MPYLYILQCADNTYYTGSTVGSLEKRLYEHSNGIGADYTMKRLPVKLIYSEFFENVKEAFYREKQIQGWSHAKKNALIEGNFDLLVKKRVVEKTE